MSKNYCNEFAEPWRKRHKQIKEEQYFEFEFFYTNNLNKKIIKLLLKKIIV